MFDKTMIRRMIAVALTATMLGGPPDVFGNTITVTQTGVGTGTIGTTPFTAADFTITSIADTDSRVQSGKAFGLPNESASILIDGVGSYQFITPTAIFVNNGSGEPGFQETASEPQGGPYDLFDGPQNSAFLTWGMQTSIGPISGTAELIQWFGEVQTSGGILNFQIAGSVPSTFQATVCTSSRTLHPRPAWCRPLGLVAYVWRHRAKTMVRGLLAVALLASAVTAQADVFNMGGTISGGTWTGLASLQFVTVGNPGNPPDPATGSVYGSVSYNYNIDAYDVTLGQYCQFLNAVAQTDTYGLYNSYMSTDYATQGISRSGSPAGSYS